MGAWGEGKEGKCFVICYRRGVRGKMCCGYTGRTGTCLGHILLGSRRGWSTPKPSKNHICAEMRPPFLGSRSKLWTPSKPSNDRFLSLTSNSPCSTREGGGLECPAMQETDIQQESRSLNYNPVGPQESAFELDSDGHPCFQGLEIVEAERDMGAGKRRRPPSSIFPEVHTPLLSSRKRAGN